MDQEALNKRVEAVNEKIAKIEKRIKKHQDRQTEAAFIKDNAPWYSQDPKSIKTMEDLIQARWNTMDSKYANDKDHPYTIDNSRSIIEKDYKDFIDNEKHEVLYAQRDLDEQNTLLAKYKAELDKKDAFQKQEKIAVIWDFLQQYKKQVHDWIVENAQKLMELRTNEDSAWKEYIQDNDIQSEVEKGNSYRYHRDFLEEYYAIINPLTYEVYVKPGKVDEALLNRKLDDDIAVKYDYFIKQIKELAGDIVDANKLTVSPKGELNGLVHGTLNDVDVWTTLSGGVVQCYHYRTYVHIAK
jgi:hypothetical protein